MSSVSSVEDGSESESDEISLASFVRRLYHFHHPVGSDSSDEDSDIDSGCNDISCPHCSPGGDVERTPVLFDRLKQGDWEDALSRMRSHRHEALSGTVQHGTALNAAFTNMAGNHAYSAHVPLEVVEAILDACGKTYVRAHDTSILNTIVADWCHWEFGATDDSMPAEQEQENRLEVIKKLVSVDRTFAKDALNPLFRIWRKVYDSDSIDLLDEFTKIKSIDELTGFPKTLFSLINMVLYSVAYNTFLPYTRKRFHFLLHSTLQLFTNYEIQNIPISMVGHVLELVDHETFTERDHKGNTPLLLLITVFKETANRAYSMDIPEAIRFIMQASEGSASMADMNGRLPLHLALENGMDWEAGVEDIMYDAPKAISTRDVKTRLYPFMTAAVDDVYDLNTVFQLLQQSPLVAKGLSGKPYWEHMSDLEEKNKILEHENSIFLDSFKRNRDSNKQLRKTVQEQSNEIELKNSEIFDLRTKVELLTKVEGGPFKRRKYDKQL